MTGYRVGIDLGTTYSLVAALVDGEPRVLKAQLRVALRVTINHLIEPELLNESLELARGCGSLVEIDEMRLDSTLGEEPQSFSGVGAFLHAKDLNFHRLRRTVI